MLTCFVAHLLDMLHKAGAVTAASEPKTWLQGQLAVYLAGLFFNATYEG
jgi:hypothetical protein